MIKLGLGRGSRRDRRAFLRGAAGVALGLPFLDSLPERSAWAAGHEPVFSLFICAVDGIVPASFFPDALGPLTADSLAAAGKATSKLSAHADNLLFVKGINWPVGFVAEPHAESLCMALTAQGWTGTGSRAMGGGPSADWVIANRVQPGSAPLALYAGNLNNGYIAERLSFRSAGEVTRPPSAPPTSSGSSSTSTRFAIWRPPSTAWATAWSSSALGADWRSADHSVYPVPSNET